MPKENFPYEAIAVLGRVLEENSKKYDDGYWRTLTVSEHCLHAKQHLYPYQKDNEEDHLAHAFVRLAVAVAVRETINRKADIVNLNQIMEFDYSHTYTWHDDWF